MLMKKQIAALKATLRVKFRRRGDGPSGSSFKPCREELARTVLLTVPNCTLVLLQHELNELMRKGINRIKKSYHIRI